MKSANDSDDDAFESDNSADSYNAESRLLKNKYKKKELNQDALQSDNSLSEDIKINKNKYKKKRVSQNSLEITNVKLTQYTTKDRDHLKDKFAAKKSDAYSPFNQRKTAKAEDSLNGIRNELKMNDFKSNATAKESKSKRTPRGKKSISPENDSNTPIQSKNHKNNSSKRKSKPEKNIEGTPKESIGTPSNVVNESSTSKLNAFQFMMESRNKRIGTNSPGKEKTEDDVAVVNSESKETLKKRKLFLEDWSDKKGGIKRKQEDVVKEKYIAKVLDKRAKRMKDMLNITDNKSNVLVVDDDSSNDSIGKYKPKRPKKSKIIVFTDSENSSDFDITQSKIDNNTLKNNSNTLEIQNNKKETNLESESIKTATPVAEKSTETLVSPTGKSNLLNYFERTPKVNSTKNDEIQKKSADSKKQSAIVGKANKQKIVEDQDNIIKVKFNFSPRKSSASKERKQRKNSESLQDSETSKSAPDTRNKKNESNDVDNCVDLNSSLNDFDIFPKRRSKCFEEKKPEKIVNKTPLKSVEECKENNKPRFSPRTWRMKIRLLDKEDVDGENVISDVGGVIDVDGDSSADESCKENKNNSGKINKSEKKQSSIKAGVKLAPLFLKQDAAAKEARKMFLNSDIPDHLKKKIEKRAVIDKIELSLFPKISHIQQKDKHSTLWDLPTADLKIKELMDVDMDVCNDMIRIGSFTETKSILNLPHKFKQLHNPPNKLRNIKQLVQDLKNECSDYPVFKTFRLLCQKCGKRFKNATETEIVVEPTKNVPKRKRGRPKRKKNVDEYADIVNMELSQISASQKVDINLSEMLMWTDKYKPQHSDDIIGNSSAVRHLKSWLLSWVDYSQTVKKSKNMNSDNEFTTDSDTCDSDMLPQNTVMLLGPLGSGKTSTVYALCNELNINIIELNASSKRTGKRILLELQEATKSHRVKNTPSNSAKNFFKPEKSESDSDSKYKKLSVLLVEDIDIYFEEQDDGFLGALNNLMSTSKRPIILTSSDPGCAHIQKIIAQKKCIIFKPLTGKILGPWLQILCLVEGVRVHRDILSDLLHWNNGDMRKTLLQLQYWTQSGGDALKKSEKENILPRIAQLSIKSSRKLSTDVDIMHEDESSNLSWLSNDDSLISEHQDEYNHDSCLQCFVPYSEKSSVKQLPHPLNLTNIWWNLPNILNIPEIKHEIKQKPADNDNNSISSDTPALLFIEDEIFDKRNKNSVNLFKIADVMDSLAFADTVMCKLNSQSDNSYKGPTTQFWQTDLVNSLSFQENYHLYNDSEGIALELAHWCINDTIRQFNDSCGQKFQYFNPSLPSMEEKRWLTKQHECCDALKTAISLSYHTDRQAVCVDYFPIMRTISRTEQVRNVLNSKRNNRFFHYLKDLGVELTDSMYEIVCNTLSAR